MNRSLSRRNSISNAAALSATALLPKRLVLGGIHSHAIIMDSLATKLGNAVSYHF
jgi:hypothetical protein